MWMRIQRMVGKGVMKKKGRSLTEIPCKVNNSLLVFFSVINICSTDRNRLSVIACDCSTSLGEHWVAWSVFTAV